MFARFGHALFNGFRLNENRPDSDNDIQANFIPLDADTADLITPTPSPVTFQASDVPDNPSYAEVEG